MNPTSVLTRYLIALAVSQLIAFLVRKGFFAAEEGEKMSPMLTDVFNLWLPIAMTSLVSFAHQAYAAFINQRLFEAARELPPAASLVDVNHHALGSGRFRTIAKFLLGVK